MEYKDILTRFEGVTGRGDKHKALCPVHNDKEASLGISFKDNRTVINCLSNNCNINDILKVTGLSIGDLKNEPSKNLGNGFYSLSDVERHLLKDEYEGFKTTKIYKYYNEDGTLAYLKTRKEKLVDDKKEKKFQFFRFENGNLFNSLEEGLYYEVFENAHIYSKKEKEGKKLEIHYQPKVLYNLLALKEAISRGKTVFVIEGEKDTDTLTKIGLTGASSPTGGGNGKDKWLKEYSEHFKGADVVVISDNDKAGKDFTELVKNSLLDYCYKVRTLTISDIEKGDLTDWYETLSDKTQAFNLIMDKIRDIKPVCPYWYDVMEEAKGKGENAQVTYKIKLKKRLLAQHLLESLNVAWVSDSAISEPIIHIYRNGVYKPVSNLRSEIEKYIHSSIDSISVISEIDGFIKNASSNYIISPSKLAGKEKIINVGNGLLDTETMILKPHTPKYKTASQLECNYNPNAANGGLWDYYINHLADGDQETINVLQEFAGLVLSNYNGYRLKGSFGLWGKPNSGKSVYLEVLSGVVGEVASGTLGIQELGERFATTVLYGKRLVYDGDLSSDGFSNVSTFKKITGGDNITVEFKGKSRLSYKYTGLYAFACNELPKLTSEKGEAVHNRVNIIRCDNVVKEKKVGLAKDIIKTEKDYIFLWALEGLKRLRANNWSLSLCKNMEGVSEEYKALSDSLYEFILEYYEVTGNSSDKVPYGKFKELYSDYCIEEGRKPIKRRDEFQKRIKHIKGMDFGQYKGNWWVKGIVEKLQEVDEDIKF